MRDRGTLIAGAGVVLAFVVAGVGYLVIRAGEASRRHAEETHAAWAAQQDELEARQQAEVAEAEVQPKRPATEAIASGVKYLIDQQSADGTWRSDTYATFKSGTALTPLVVHALQETGDAAAADAIRKGCDYLAKLVKPDGSIEGANGDLDYPVYTAAVSVIALSHPDQKRHAKARDAWLKFLLSQQLTEGLGWKPDDKQYGGWGYCRLLPKKPAPGAIAPPLVESNLSATVFALDALRTAGIKDAEPFKKALTFVERCQNYDVPAYCRAIGHLDGGFYFIYDDPVRNKAGVVDSKGEQPAQGYHSYGSATADGLRALEMIAEVHPPDDADWRRASAKGWFEQHFRASQHPGQYIPAHEPNRQAVYYYYAASVSKALRLAKVKAVGTVTPKGVGPGKPWAPALAAELVNRQKPDGSWVNPVELVRENEPLVATANAVIALANCMAAEKP